MTSLDVYLHGDLAGTLERLDGARLRFTYDSDWLSAPGTPLSLSLRLREEPYVDPDCRPFFAGLLPEGGVLKAIARTFHISAGNPFTVLREIGGECAGAVSLVDRGAPPPFSSAPGPRWLSNRELASLLEELPRHPLLTDAEDDEGIRLSLAGTRGKLGVLTKDGRVGITRGKPPSTHILKVPPKELSGLVANEAYCMALAGEVGLSVAPAAPLRADHFEALLVERYDRFRAGSRVRRFHQEDLCQAARRLPEAKYESEGGPGVAECGALIRARAPLRPYFHACLRTPVRPQKMAMKYGGEYRPDRIRGRHLDRLGDALGIAHRRVRKHAEAMAETAVQSRGAARERLEDPWRQDPILDSIDETIGRFAGVLGAAAAEPA